MSSPLLEASVEGATGILLNITGGSDLGLFEVNEAAEVVTGAADREREHHLRRRHRRALGDGVRVTVIATGFDGRTAASAGAEERPRARRPAERERAPAEGFDVPAEVLEVPSFLRDDS